MDNMMTSKANDDDDKVEAISSISHQQQHSQGILDDNFRQLLVDIAEWYDRLGYINMLKVLYRDHLNNNYELNMATKMMDLLRLLIGSGNLSSTNLTIIYDTVKATEQFGFEPTFKNQLPNVRGTVISTFTRYRLRLIKLGMKLTPHDVVKLDGRYNMPLLKNYGDNWSLITDLEDRGELCEVKMDTFIEVLQRNGLTLAVRALLDDDVLKRPHSVLTRDEGDEMGAPVLKMAKLVLPSTQDVIIREYLLNRQQKVCRNTNRFTPATLNPRYQVDIAHMFTDLDLVKENKKKQDAKPTTLEEVLDIIKSTPACKVLIDGEGGIGKTTLLRYISYNWAIKASNETFKGKIVFPVNIRDIDKGEDILDVIVKQMKLKDFHLKTNLPEDPKLIKRFIMNHDDEIVLLLDGLDELRDGNESPISLFKNEELENSKVILTSRSEKIDAFIKESNIYVKVKGFNADNIKKYIKKHFNFFEVPVLGDSLIKELELDEEDEEYRGNEHPEVYSMCKNPMLLLSVCTMWEEKQYLPADKTVLFKEVFRSILNQFNRQEANEQKISTFEDTPEKFVNAMLVLGKCMYEGLKSNQLYVNKKYLEGNKEMVALALKLGFVYKDAPNKADFEEIFTAPHKLIVESLVGFYLYKLCQTAGFENKCVEDMGKLLTPLDDNEWEIIRESEHLNMAREFAVGFLGAEAGNFLNHWITNNFSTYRSLMTYLKLVKEEHRVVVENTLNDHMAKKDLDIKPHIDDTCKSLRRFIQHMNPGVQVNEDEHFIILMRSLYGIGPMHSEPLREISLIESFCKDMSSKETGRMLAHIMIVVPNQKVFLEEIHEVYTDDVVKHLIAECQKLNFKYDITSYSLHQSPITASYIVHLLTDSPKLQFLNLDVSITWSVANDMIRECTLRGVTLKLTKIFFRDNNLRNIDGSSLASLIIITPNLNHLCMIKCSLSGVIMNEMIRKCFSRGVALELEYLDISDNDLSNIHGSSLAYLMVIAPKLNNINMSNCSLSGEAINDMTRGCSSRGVKLELEKLDISGSNLNNIVSSSLASLMIIAPKLKNIDMSNCSLSGDVMNYTITEFFSRGVKLKLNVLKISGNKLSNIDGSLLGSLMSITPKLNNLYMDDCSLSGVIMNDMSRKCSSCGGKLVLENLNISDNNLSRIYGSSLVSLMVNAPKLTLLDIHNCSLSGDVMNDMSRDFSNRGVKLELSDLIINGNNLSNTDGSSLASLMITAPAIDMFYMHDCSLSGDIMNAMIRKCFSRGVALTLIVLNISGNNLSNIHGSSLASLMIIAPKLINLHMSNCSLSGDILNDMSRECSSRGVKLKLQSLDTSCNNLSNIDCTLLASLINSAPEMFHLDMNNCSLSCDIKHDITTEFSSRGVELDFDCSDGDVDDDIDAEDGHDAVDRDTGDGADHDEW